MFLGKNPDLKRNLKDELLGKTKHSVVNRHRNELRL